MIQIEYPTQNFRLKEEDNKEFIFDDIRKQWIRLTPEEWVRQNFITFLVQVKKYPASLMAVEKEIKLGELRKRCDIIVYNNAQPWMIVECKEMNVLLSEATVKQILNYNAKLDVDYIVITNGNTTFAAETKTAKWLEELPNF